MKKHNINNTKSQNTTSILQDNLKDNNELPSLLITTDLDADSTKTVEENLLGSYSLLKVCTTGIIEGSNLSNIGAIIVNKVGSSIKLGTIMSHEDKINSTLDLTVITNDVTIDETANQVKKRYYCHPTL